LFGAWALVTDTQNDDLYSFIIVGRSGHKHLPTGTMKAIFIGSNRDGDIKIEEPMYFFSCSIGAGNYLTFLPKAFSECEKLTEWFKSCARSFYLARYTIEKNRLKIWLVNDDGADTAIKKGKLKGTVESQRRKMKHIKLTSSTEELRQYLLDGGDNELFSDKDPLVLKRVK